MHADPGRRWTLQDLALVAGMSRSTFAARFKTTVGEPAMDYLTRWRMMLAADRLAKGRFSISTVAPAVGYESDSAFSAAFKRVIGRSPREFVNSRPEKPVAHPAI
jgi:AraC-like DNA-binding protein